MSSTWDAIFGKPGRRKAGETETLVIGNTPPLYAIKTYDDPSRIREFVTVDKRIIKNKSFPSYVTDNPDYDIDRKTGDKVRYYWHFYGAWLNRKELGRYIGRKQTRTHIFTAGE